MFGINKRLPDPKEIQWRGKGYKEPFDTSAPLFYTEGTFYLDLDKNDYISLDLQQPLGREEISECRLTLRMGRKSAVAYGHFRRNPHELFMNGSMTELDQTVRPYVENSEGLPDLYRNNALMVLNRVKDESGKKSRLVNWEQ